MGGKRKPAVLRVTLGHETLESRTLLAGLVGDSPWQNPLDADDLNSDGSVSASDALVAINAINGSGAGELSGKFAPPMLAGRVKNAVADFLDANGDGQLSAGDALEIVNRINNRLGGPGSDLPTTDQQGNTPDTAQPLDLTRGFAKVRSAINADTAAGADVDYFKITPAKTNLSVALFSAGGKVMTVTVLDAAGTAIGDASTIDGSFLPAKADVTVQTNQTYYLKVAGASGVTGVYGLAVLNFNPADFPPDTDSPLGTDIHGDTTATATVLKLDRGTARVASNIDAAGDADMFALTTAATGKLVVESDGDLPLTVTLADASGKMLTPIVATQHVLVANVTAGATYYVTVAAANGTDTGAYHLRLVNVSLPGDSGDDRPRLPTAQELFAKLDADASGSISLQEFKDQVPLGRTALVDRVFANWDTDKSGDLSLDEFVSGLKSFPSLIPRRSDDDAGTPLVTTN